MMTLTQTARKVFLVDDHDMARELLAEYLEATTDLVMSGTASSGREALDQLPPECYDLALIDVRMPGMNGIELTQHLKRECPDLPCLMVSAHAEHVYVERALAAGAQGYVMKGDPERILEAIQQVLQGEVYLSEQMRRNMGGSA